MKSWWHLASFSAAVTIATLSVGCGGGGGSTNNPPPVTYTLTVNTSNPTTGVAITVTPADNSGASSGTATFTRTYNAGSAVTLTAPATAGSNNFSSWSGCASASTETCHVTMNGNVSVTAKYSTVSPVTSSVSIDQSSIGPQITDQLLGMNLAAWYDIGTNATSIVNAFGQAGIKAVRWPGGSWSDIYHWSTNTACGNYPNSNDTFANFMNEIAIPGGYDVALTADYGSNAACNGGGDPTEAAAWVTAALNGGVTVSHMTVGNEEYGSWEEDLHTKPNDPTTYASAVTGTNGYYKLIKAASPNTLVGVDVEADNTAGGWDETVLANAKGFYDFVELHFYPQGPGQESDAYLVQQAARDLTNNINILKTELSKAGEPNMPIYVGEMGSVYSNPGKQSMSITQGLYAGQMLGEMMNDGVSRATWWIGFGNCNGTSGNDSSSLYGWQNFGAYNVFADGPTDAGCAGAGSIGTMSPTARAFQLFSKVALNGESVLTANVTGDTTNVRAYAATSNGGTALVLFNLSQSASEAVAISLSAQSTSSDVTVETYSKAIYDQSQNNVWAPPTMTDMGSQNLPLTLTLDPWSMNVVIIK